MLIKTASNSYSDFGFPRYVLLVTLAGLACETQIVSCFVTLRVETQQEAFRNFSPGITMPPEPALNLWITITNLLRVETQQEDFLNYLPGITMPAEPDLTFWITKTTVACRDAHHPLLHFACRVAGAPYSITLANAPD